MQWAFADGLGVNPKGDSGTIRLTILILRQVTNPSLCQDSPQRYYWQKFGEITPTTDLYAQGGISVHAGFRQRRASNSGPSVSSPTLNREGYHGPVLTSD